MFKFLTGFWGNHKVTSRGIVIAIIYALGVEVHKQSANATIAVGLAIVLGVIYLIITGFINSPKELSGIIDSFKGNNKANKSSEGEENVM